MKGKKSNKMEIWTKKKSKLKSKKDEDVENSDEENEKRNWRSY